MVASLSRWTTVAVCLAAWSSLLIGHGEGVSPGAPPPANMEDLPPGQAQQTISGYLHEEVGKHLAEVKSAMEQLRQTLRANYVGKEINGDYHVVTSAEVEAWFAEPLANLEKRIADNESQFQLLQTDTKREKITLDDYYLYSYRRVADSIGWLWALYLNEAGDRNRGIPALIRAEMRHIEDDFNRQWNALTLDEQYGQRKAVGDGLKAMFEQRRHAMFDSACRRYRIMLSNLTQRRERWARIAWNWQDFAFRQIRREGDAHDYGRAELRGRVYGSFGTGNDSQIDFYMNFPGTTDRLIFGYSDYAWCKAMPYPDIQVSDMPGLVKANSFAKAKVETFHSAQPEIRAAFVRANDVPSGTYRVEGRDDTVVPVRYAAGKKLAIALAANGYGSHQEIAEPALSLTVKNVLAADNRAVMYPASLLNFRFNDRGTGTVELEIPPLLGQLGTGLNANLLSVEPKGTVAGRQVTSAGLNLGHIMRQKLILFIPGVLGSEIYVTRNGQTQMAFPRMSLNVAGQQPFTWLTCGKNGEPLPGNEAVQLDLFRKYTLAAGVGQTVYDVENQPWVVNPPGHPKLTVNGRPSPHYILVPWAYDWRLRLEYAVSRLTGSGRGDPQGRMRPPYRTPPSIQELMESTRKENPLLDDKAVVVGHSTGGVIIRSLVTQWGIERQVDIAGFVDAPLWGAPKAYYVYLIGDMGVPIISKGFMVQLSPNCPIVYYLSPTERYPQDVAVLPDGTRVRRSAGQSVGAFMAKLIAAAKTKGLYPKQGVADWNADLERSAQNYHAAAAAEPRIGWQNCLVFWSDSGKGDTPGAVSVVSFARRAVDGPRRMVSEVRFAKVPGDSTVPVVSQQAEFGQHPGCLVEIASHPEHVPSPNQSQVWETLVRRIMRP